MYTTHDNLVMIIEQVRIWKIARILIDEGSGSGFIFKNCFERMQLPKDIIQTILEIYVVSMGISMIMLVDFH